MSYVDFSGKKIMVVGASSGIGKETSILLSQLGARVVLVSRSHEKLQMVKSQMLNSNEHVSVSYDVKDIEGCKAVFEQAVADGQKLTGLVYCTGIAKPVPLRVVSYSEYNHVFTTNYYGFINTAGWFARRKFNAGGSIVAVSALNAHYPQKCMTLYASSKAAMEVAVRTLAVELAERNIRINSVVPGAVDTPMSNAVDQAMRETIVSKQLLGMQSPNQIADCIVYLLSDRASAITGRNLFVDGGMLGQ